MLKSIIFPKMQWTGFIDWIYTATYFVDAVAQRNFWLNIPVIISYLSTNKGTTDRIFPQPK